MDRSGETGHTTGVAGDGGAQQPTERNTMFDLYTDTLALVTIHTDEETAKAHAHRMTADGCPTRAYKRTVKVPGGSVVIWFTADARGA